MTVKSRRNRYYVKIRKNGTEEIKMVAKAYDRQLAQDVAVNHLQMEDPTAKYEVVESFRIS
jgi:hypothetical protein